jgi:hypothetical protein
LQQTAVLSVILPPTPSRVADAASVSSKRSKRRQVAEGRPKSTPVLVEKPPWCSYADHSRAHKKTSSVVVEKAHSMFFQEQQGGRAKQVSLSATKAHSV